MPPSACLCSYLLSQRVQRVEHSLVGWDQHQQLLHTLCDPGRQEVMGPLVCTCSCWQTTSMDAGIDWIATTSVPKAGHNSQPAEWLSLWSIYVCFITMKMSESGWSKASWSIHGLHTLRMNERTSAWRNVQARNWTSTPLKTLICQFILFPWQKAKRWNNVPEHLSSVSHIIPSQTMSKISNTNERFST